MSCVARALLGAGLLLAFCAPVAAQPALDRSAFDRACLENGTVLIGPIDPSLDRRTVLEPLCGCISGELSKFSQADIDMLAADLSGSATEVDRAAYGDYAGLVSRASAVVTACFADPRLLGAPASQ